MKLQRRTGEDMAVDILIVEDDLLLGEAIQDYFKSKGWNTNVAIDGEVALELFEQNQYQLILLDVMLPKQNGFTVCRKIREQSDVPIFFITARVMEEDELNGYAVGADDYITKPFSLPVLYAKATAIVSRTRGESFRKICKGDIEVDVRTHEVKVKGEARELPPLEYQLLLFFLENPNRIYSREQLLIRFWGYDFDGNERVVDNHIKKLRKGIEGSICKIQTVRKNGYRMEV